MNLYIILPLSSLVVNMILCFYVIRTDSRNSLNRLYALLTFSMVIWSLGNIIRFASPSPETIIQWELGMSTVSAIFASSFLLHFTMIFAKSKFLARKTTYLVMYSPVLFFSVIIYATDFIIAGTRSSSWGYAYITGFLYIPFTLCVVLYAAIASYVSFRVYQKSPSSKIRKQAKFLTFGIAVPLIAGSITEIVPFLLAFDMIPLTATTSTVTAILIAYTAIKHGFMSMTPGMAGKNIIDIMPDYVVGVNADSTIALLNRSVLEALGYRKEELINKHAKTIINKWGDFARSKGFRDMVHGNPIKDCDIDITTKEGESIPVSVSASVIRDDKSGLIGYVFVMRNVRETNELVANLRKKTRELEKAKAELEKRVNELERFGKVTVGRELKMIDLKKRLKGHEAEKSGPGSGGGR